MTTDTTPPDPDPNELERLAGPIPISSGRRRRAKSAPAADPGDTAQIPAPPSGAIAITGGSLAANATASQEVLLDAGAPIYQHGDRLVRVGRADRHRGGPDRSVGAPILRELTVAWLVDELTTRARYVRYDRRSGRWVASNAPRNVAETILARAGAWPFPRLVGFVEAPLLAPDGRIIDTPGYDADTGLYLLIDPGD